MNIYWGQKQHRNYTIWFCRFALWVSILRHIQFSPSFVNAISILGKCSINFAVHHSFGHCGLYTIPGIPAYRFQFRTVKQYMLSRFVDTSFAQLTYHICWVLKYLHLPGCVPSNNAITQLTFVVHSGLYLQKIHQTFILISFTILLYVSSWGYIIQDARHRRHSYSHTTLFTTDFRAVKAPKSLFK